MKTRVSVFFHNFYGQHKHWREFFCEKIPVPFDIYYNIVEKSIYNIKEEIITQQELPKIPEMNLLNKLNVRLSSNKGKDIGGKLVLMDALLRMAGDADYILFFHDKQSPHKVHNQQWQEKLFEIVEPGFAERAIAYFNNYPKTGIVATAESIRNEFDETTGSFVSNNKEQIARLRSVYNIKSSDHRFVAGTMFWARTKPLVEFFIRHAPLDIRKELEPGNVIDETQGTNTHAWERMLSWIILEQGYDMKGI